LFSLAVLAWNEVSVGSGDDLSNMFYMFEHNADWIVRNAFGNIVEGRDYLDLGCEAGRQYYLFFRVVCMGDKMPCPLPRRLPNNVCKTLVV